MDTPILPTKPPVLTSSSLAGANNVLFSFEKNESSSKSKPKPKPKPQEPPVVKPKTCKTCQKKGHSWKECPTPDINKKCSNCQKIGHTSQNCKFIILSFAKYQPPKPEPRPPRNQNSTDNKDQQQSRDQNKSKYKNNNNENQQPEESTTTTTTTTTTNVTSDIVVTNGSPKQDSSASPKNSSSPKLNSTKPNSVPQPMVAEQIKLIKDVLSRQLFIVNPSSGWTIPDNLPEIARQSAATSVCLPAIIKDGKLDSSVTKCIKSLHAYGIQAPLSFEIDNSALLAEHPEWCAADESQPTKVLSVANTEFQAYFTKLFGDCLKQLIESKSDIGPMDGFYIELPINEAEDESINNFKQNLIFMIKDINTIDKTKKQPANKPIHQIVFFTSKKPEKTSNLFKLSYNSENEFAISSRYQYQIPVIGEISMNLLNSNTFKTYDTIWFECTTSLILSNRFSVRLNASQLSNKYCLPMVEKLFKSMVDKEIYCKNARLICDVGVITTGITSQSLLNSLTCLLEEFNYQYNFIQQPINTMDFTELSRYRLLILADQPCLSGDAWVTLQKFVSQGGSILVTGDAALDSLTSNFSISTAGIKYTKQSDLPTTDSLSVVEKKNKSQSIQDSNFNLSMLQLTGRNGMVESTSNDTVSLLNISAADIEESAAILYSNAQRTIYCAHPLFTQYWQQGDRAICDIFRSMMRILLPDPVVNLGVQPIRSLSAFVTHQQLARTKTVDGYNRYIVHLLNADSFTIGNNNQCHEVAKDIKHLSLTVNLPKDQSVDSVVAAGDIDKEIKHKVKGNQLTIEISTLTKHSIIVINFKQ